MGTGPREKMDLGQLICGKVCFSEKAYMFHKTDLSESPLEVNISNTGKWKAMGSGQRHLTALGASLCDISLQAGSADQTRVTWETGRQEF